MCQFTCYVFVKYVVIQIMAFRSRKGRETENIDRELTIWMHHAWSHILDDDDLHLPICCSKGPSFSE